MLSFYMWIFILFLFFYDKENPEITKIYNYKYTQQLIFTAQSLIYQKVTEASVSKHQFRIGSESIIF
jgi:hypothetical protein